MNWAICPMDDRKQNAQICTENTWISSEKKMWRASLVGNVKVFWIWRKMIFHMQLQNISNRYCQIVASEQMISSSTSENKTTWCLQRNMNTKFIIHKWRKWLQWCLIMPGWGTKDLKSTHFKRKKRKWKFKDFDIKAHVQRMYWLNGYSIAPSTWARNDCHERNW